MSMSDVQFVAADGVIDLTWGHPDPALLPVADVAAATDRVLRDHGWQALAYGAPAGPESLRRAIAAHLRAGGEGDVDPREVLVTAGASGGLELLLSLFARRRDVVFVEQPTYFLALKILSDHGVEVVGLAADRDGTDPEDLARRAAVVREHGDGRRMFFYCIPTFANPTGRSLTRDRRLAFLDAAAAADVTVIEDDVYRDTAPNAPPSMWSLNRNRIRPAAAAAAAAKGASEGAAAKVIRLGSFSKPLAPGLRVGYLTAPVATVDRIADCGLLDSGGGINHFAAMVVADLLDTGRYAEIAATNATVWRARRDALAGSIDPSVLGFDTPAGGFFLWLRVPPGITSFDFVTAARDNGVLVADGRPFFTDLTLGHFVRASFSMLDEAELSKAGAMLTAAARSVSGG